MKRILIVDDEQNIREVLKEYLEFNGFEVITADDGYEAVDMCKREDYDFIVMDIMMPKMDDKLFGFEAGIDDYVTKPFSPKEVVARIKAILGRTAPEHPVNKRNVKKFGGLIVDFDGRNVIVDGKKADLTPKEYEVLFFLVKNEGLAISREKLLSNVWGFDFYGDDRTVDTHIKMLRSNLGPYRDCIVTLRGLGYKFEYDENIEY